MLALRFLGIGSLVMAQVAFSADPAVAQDTLRARTAALARLHQELVESLIVQRDTQLFAERALESFVVIIPGGRLETRAQNIRGAQNFRVDSLRFADVDVRLHERTAIVTATVAMFGALRVGRRGRADYVDVTGEYRTLAVYVDEGGRWRLLAESLTPVGPIGVPIPSDRRPP